MCFKVTLHQQKNAFTAKLKINPDKREVLDNTPLMLVDYIPTSTINKPLSLRYLHDSLKSILTDSKPSFPDAKPNIGS